MIKWIALTLVAGLLAGCSQSDSKGSKDGDANSQADSNKKTFQESYQFEVNHCDTGVHMFSVNSTPEETQKKLCEALQDDSLNRSCAEQARKEYFIDKCQGYVWSPKYQPVADPGAPSSAPDARIERKVEDALEYVLVDSYALSENLGSPDKRAMTQLGESLMSCGLNYVGPQCLDYNAMLGNYPGVVSLQEGKIVFYTELNIKGMGSMVALVFNVEQIEPEVKIGSVGIFKILKANNGLPVDQYLKDSTALSALGSAALVSDFESGAKKRLEAPRDLRELYHVSAKLQQVHSIDGSRAAAESAIKNAIAKHKNLITQSKDVRYQEEMLNFITSQVVLKKELLLEICKGLLNSDSDKVKQIAAVYALDLDPSQAELKPIVLQALSRGTWDVQAKALSALSKVQLSMAEENILLAKIGDGDGDVRAAALAATANLPLNDNHLQTALDLSKSTNWEVALQAAVLLSRINSPKAIQALIGMLSHGDGDVHKKVVALLKAKTLSNDSTSDLAKEMDAPNWEVRRDAANLLGKIGSKEALLVLILKLSDGDQDVRAAIGTILNAAPLNNNFVQALSDRFSSSNWEVRKEAAKLLGRIKSPDSLKALQAQLAKESDEDVKAQLKSSIRAAGSM